jgi:hypothetical protein
VAEVTFAGVSFVVALALLFLYRFWHEGVRGPNFVIAALPMALLFLAVPAPVTAIQMIRGFRSLATSTGGAYATAAGWCVAIDRALLFGCLGCAVTLAIAGLLQFRAVQYPAAPATPDTAPVPDDAWRLGIFHGSVLLILPTAFLVLLDAQLPRLVLGQILGVAHGSAQLAETSRLIAMRLTTVAFLGVVMTGGCVLWSAAALAGIGDRQVAAAPARYTWILLVVLIAALVLTTFLLTRELDWIRHAGQQR